MLASTECICSRAMTNESELEWNGRIGQHSRVERRYVDGRCVDGVDKMKEGGVCGWSGQPLVVHGAA